MCNMDNDTSTGQFAVNETNVNDTENQTHPASESTNVHDVDTLLSCINLWEKNSQECAQPTNADVLNRDRISIKLNNDVQRVNNVVNGLLSMTSLRAEIPENVVVANRDSEEYQMDESTLISKENFPMELSDDEDLPPHLRRNYTSNTMDTRFASESSGENNGEFDFPFDLNKDPNYLTLQMIDSQGNSLGSRGPDSEDERLACARDGINNVNMTQLESIDHEIEEPEETIEMDQTIDYDKLGQFVHSKEDFETTILRSGTIVEIDEPVAEVKPIRTYKGRNSRKKSSRGRRRKNLRKVITEKDVLSLGSIECPVITENGRLRCGRTYLNPKREASNPSEKKVNGKSLHTAKNTNKNPQADQVVDNREMEFEKIRGVCYCKSDNSWTAWWTEKGKSRKKAFKLSLYGYEGARRMAIEHRMRMEELLPELKEKKTKMNRRKSPEAQAQKTSKKSPGTTSRKTAKPCSNTPAATVPSVVDGIYMGTRNRSKEKKDKQGVLSAENTVQTNLEPAIDSNLPTPQVNQVPLSESIQNTEDTHSDNKDTIVNTNEDANLAPTDCKRSNDTETVGYTINIKYKRRKTNSHDPNKSRLSEIEYVMNVERAIEEEVERVNEESNQGITLGTGVQSNPQISATLNIVSHNIEQSSAESGTTKTTEQKKEAKVNSLRYQIKLEKSTVEEFHKAIRKALENLPAKDAANEQDKENQSPEVTSTPQDTQNPQSPSAEQNYEFDPYTKTE